MTRLKRAESQALTRKRLLSAAGNLFGGEGYASPSVERIAEAAGYSKGALYSNFESKEAIFLAVLEEQGRGSLDELLSALDGAGDAAAVMDLLVGWADARSGSGGWALAILEHARTAQPGSTSVRRQREILSGHWRRLGDCLLARFPGVAPDGETLGALLHEIAYAPAMTLMTRPTSGDLMRLALGSLLAQAAIEGAGTGAVAASRTATRREPP